MLAASVAFVLAVTAVAACSRRSARDAAVVLSGVRDATITQADGTTHAASEGERLRPDDRVRTGPDGAATLTVLGRATVLGGATGVRVPDGETLELAEGSLLVDRRRGPAMTLVAGEVTVDRIARGAVRVDRSYSLLVTVYAGEARVRTTAGRQVLVPRLHRAEGSGRNLAGDPRPLRLRRDAWERRVIGGIVDSDVALERLARGIDAGFGRGGSAVPAVFGPVPAGVRASETVLASAIAVAASTRDPARLRQRVSGYRDQGASWGVVAALLGTDAHAASAALDALVTGRAPAPIALPQPSVPSVGPVLPSVGPGPGVPEPGRTPAPQPTRSRTPAPPSPSASPSSSGGIVEDLGKLVPSATPSASLPVLDWFF